MEAENTLAKNITSAGDKVAYDASCKRLLANKTILVWVTGHQRRGTEQFLSTIPNH